ncbi:MAG: DUF58 domain-containing protein [Xanthomonadales bacterium]|nr:DUF58 domain-containing protein [Xanthomonadales bacterium]
MTDAIVNRIKLRAQGKRGPLVLPFELEYRHIYILPTSFGWGFGLMLAFMALGGLNFNNNMALMLVFLLATIAQLTTLIAYRNMSGLKIDSIFSEPVFCGENAHFLIFISNQNERQRFALQAGFGAAQDCKDFKLNATESFHLQIPTMARGWLEMPSFRLETRFPLGLFKAWSWVFPQSRCLVYPSPAKNAPALPESGHGHAGRAIKGDGDQLHGLRKYQPGDSKQRIAWRASARHDELYSLEMEKPREEACELDWDLLQGTEAETRLSILTAWVIAADHKQLSYSLKLPGEFIASGHGTKHRANCLELLALHLL